LRQEVTDEDIARVVAAWTGIPIRECSNASAQKLIKWKSAAAARYRPARSSRCHFNACAARSGLQDPESAHCSFIFLGPTVGQTETTRAPRRIFVDDENAMIRIDMSEYMENTPWRV